MIMVYKLGRLLQIIGLILLPMAIAGNVAREDVITLGISLKMAAVGIAVFAVGWFIQQRGKPQ